LLVCFVTFIGGFITGGAGLKSLTEIEGFFWSSLAEGFKSMPRLKRMLP
jgi:hypothetical protein